MNHRLNARSLAILRNDPLRLKHFKCLRECIDHFEDLLTHQVLLLWGESAALRSAN